MLHSTAIINDELQENELAQSPIEALIMDWAGTTVDFGSVAPIKGFQLLFAKYQISITEEETRLPMGTEKREHIKRLLEMPRIKQLWIKEHGKEATDTDIDEMYQAFIPMQITAISECNALIPGLLDVLEWLKDRKIKIGANTGYGEEMVKGLLEEASKQGYEPQSNVCATQVTHGRPYPNMCLMNAMQLSVKTLAHCIKVDDTAPGIEEGINAGMWTIGLSVSGNEVGLSLGQWQALYENTQNISRLKASQKLQNVGADYVVDTIADIIPCLLDIENRIRLGERP